jgi:hypothetical protein
MSQLLQFSESQVYFVQSLATLGYSPNAGISFELLVAADSFLKLLDLPVQLFLFYVCLPFALV